MPAMRSNRISNIFVIKSALMKLHLFAVTHSKKNSFDENIKFKPPLSQRKNAAETLYFLMHCLAPF